MDFLNGIDSNVRKEESMKYLYRAFWAAITRERNIFGKKFPRRQSVHVCLSLSLSLVDICVTDAKRRSDARFHWKIEPRTTPRRDALSGRHVWFVTPSLLLAHRHLISTKINNKVLLRFFSFQSVAPRDLNIIVIFIYRASARVLSLSYLILSLSLFRDKKMYKSATLNSRRVNRKWRLNSRPLARVYFFTITLSGKYSTRSRSNSRNLPLFAIFILAVLLFFYSRYSTDTSNRLRISGHTVCLKFKSRTLFRYVASLSCYNSRPPLKFIIVIRHELFVVIKWDK